MGSRPPLICVYITLSSCQSQGGQEVCVQEGAFQSPSYCDMWKGNRPDFRTWTGRQEQVAKKVLVCFFFRKEVRTKSLGVSTPVPVWME